MRTPDYERRARAAVERLDVLEEEVPGWTCHARGCTREARYEWAGAFSDTHWLCSTHRRAYWVHDRILKRIRAI